MRCEIHSLTRDVQFLTISDSLSTDPLCTRMCCETHNSTRDVLLISPRWRQSQTLSLLTQWVNKCGVRYTISNNLIEMITISDSLSLLTQRVQECNVSIQGWVCLPLLAVHLLQLLLGLRDPRIVKGKQLLQFLLCEIPK